MQDFLQKTNAKDASGNVVFGDIGVHIQQEVGGCVLCFDLFHVILISMILVTTEVSGLMNDEMT